MTQDEINQKVIEDYVDAFNRGDMEKIRPLFTNDAVVHGVLGWGPIDIIVPVWRELHASFAIQLKIEAMIVNDNDVAVRYHESGMFRAPFRGQPSTGKSYELIAMEWFLLRDGKIHRRWGGRDSASQARQVGMKLS